MICRTSAEDMADATLYNPADDPNSLINNQGAFDPQSLIDRANKIRERANLVNDASTIAQTSGPTGENLTNGERNLIRSTSKFIRNEIDAHGAAYEQSRRDRMEQAQIYAQGLTTGSISPWMGIIGKIDNWFKDERNAFSMWAQKFALDTKESSYNQPLVQKLQMMRNRIRAQQNIFQSWVASNLDPLVRPLANRTGHKVNEMRSVLGHYAVMRHIPEANNYLLNKAWPERVAAIQAELDDILAGKQQSTADYFNSLQTEQSELLNRIKLLQDNIENETKPYGMYCAGYTNAQARKLASDILSKFDISEQEANAVADKFTDGFNFIISQRHEKGTIRREQMEKFPDFKHYVPLLSDVEMDTGPANDTTRFTLGSYYAMQGTANTPASAMNALIKYMNKASNEIGSQDFATHLLAFHKEKSKYTSERIDAIIAAGGKHPEDDNGLRSMKYASLVKALQSGNMTAVTKANNILNAGGLVVDDLVVDKRTGQSHYDRKYLWFDSNWLDENPIYSFTGHDLNQAVIGESKTVGKGVELAGRLSSMRGQLFTRFSLGFAPLGGVRDGMERIANMFNRSYFDDAGNKLGTMDTVTDFITNTPRAAQILFDGIFRPDTLEGRAAQYWKEFNETGAMQIMTPGMDYSKSSLAGMLEKKKGRVASLLEQADKEKWLARTKNMLGQYGEAALSQLDKYNSYFQTIGAFDQFITLREKGVSAARAAEYTTAEMNMSQRGTLTPYLRILSPFVVPTVQSAAALMRTLGFSTNAKTPLDIIKAGKNGWLGVLGGAIAASVLYDISRKSLGYDEEGRSYFDAMPVRDLISYMPFRLEDGAVFKSPVGFGAIRLGLALAATTDRVARGLMEPEDMAAEILFAAAKDVAPMTNPQFSFSDKPTQFVMQMLTPDALKPIMEVASNTGYFGNTLADEPRKDTARADQGRLSTDPFFHHVAKFFSRNGFADAPPEHYKHFFESYMAGPLRALSAVFSTMSSNRFGDNEFEGLQPWLQAFGMTGWVGRDLDPGKTAYYDYRRSVMDKIQRAGLKMTDSENSGDAEKAKAYRRRVLEESGVFSDSEIADYELMRDVDKELSEANKSFNKQYKDIWYNMDSPDEVRDAFKTLSDAKKASYARFTRESHYYKDRQ